MNPRKTLALGLTACVLACLLLFALDVAMGPVTIPLADVWSAITGGSRGNESFARIVTLFRLPKAITALVAGAALAVSGLLMQTLFRNPLAGPYVLGLDSGASLGVAIVILASGSLAGSGAGGASFIAGAGWLAGLGAAAAASLGAALVFILVLVVARRVDSAVTVLMLGVLFSYGTNAAVSILISSARAEKIQSYLSWTFGSFSSTRWEEVAVFAPLVALGVALAGSIVKPLNLLLLGERYAESSGADPARTRSLIIASTAILSGAVTAFCGPISFIGLAIPHLARLLFGTSDHRTLIPACVLTGSACALAADIVSQLPGTGISLPLNAVTAIIGVPVLIWVILSRSRGQGGIRL
jgi:iron complex transport system permease protein